MPYKPAKPCAHRGCRALTYDRFCPEHAKQEARNYEKYRRNPATSKRYGNAWRKIREAFLAAHPLCDLCWQEDKAFPATLVHHIKPLTGGGTHSTDNLQSLCDSCHCALHASEDGHWQ